MEQKITYLITGGNRGLGLGFVKKFVSRPNTNAIAAVRDPSHPSSQALSKLSVGPSSSLIVVKNDSSSKESALKAVRDPESNHGITSIDVVVANAAISNSHPKVADADLNQIQEHFLINTIGVVALFQAVLPLLNKSEKQKKFIAISTGAASIGNMENRNKVALNWLIKKIHLEHKDIIAFPVDPGWIQTEMGNVVAKDFGFEQAEITVEQSAAGVVKLIDGATREKSSGKFWHYKGEEIPW